jgi:hypothetical protein
MRPTNVFGNSLFQPSVIRSAYGQGKTSNVSLAGDSRLFDAQDVIYDPKNKQLPFQYDQQGTPLRSTQQLNVDFSRFENHTFFNSARVKTQIAIQKIINKFPFDGTRIEYENFLSSLSGFEKYLLDSFPKSLNYLVFEGLQHIAVSDTRGTKQANDNSERTVGRPALDINHSPFTVEFYLRLPEQSNDTMVIVQRLDSQINGFTIGIEQSTSSEETDLIFLVTSDSNELHINVPFQKGKFQHVAMVYDRNGDANLKCYLDGILQKTSDSSLMTSVFEFSNIDLLIGDGNNHPAMTYNFQPTSPLIAAFDEFRLFNVARSAKLLNKHRNRNVYAQEDLKLCFRFNEPDWTGNPSQTKDLVLDSSGNGLHSRIYGFSNSMRAKISNVPTPLIAENPDQSPILFLNYESVQNLLESFLEEAEVYDVNNPNLITKMVPPHYFTEAAYEEGLQREDDYLSNYPTNPSNLPGDSPKLQTHVMSSMLYAWAEVFDDIKIFIDELGRLLKVDYIDDKTISGHLIPFLANYHGFNMPSMLSNSNINQLLYAEGLNADDTRSLNNLLEVQNTIWRRILSDLVEIRRTKGTVNSLKSVLRNIGINPNGAMRIKEYGGSRVRYIDDAFERRENTSRMLTFEGSRNEPGIADSDGIDPNRPLLRTPFLVAKRIEPGQPSIAGNWIDGMSDDPNDELLTSGSWTVEATCKLTSKDSDSKQSIIRIQTVGEDSGNVLNHVVFNAVASPPKASVGFNGSLTLWMNFSNDVETKSITIDDIDMFNGRPWYVSFSRKKNYDNDNLGSSYHLRASQIRLDGSDVLKEAILNVSQETFNILEYLDPITNSSGAYVLIGSMSLGNNLGYYLNGSGIEEAKLLNFTGRITHLNFYTKFLDFKEAQNHALNFRSAGAIDPLINYNFVNNLEGSYERLRLNYTMEQPAINSDVTGQLQIFDFSQNNFHGIATGFGSNENVIKPEKFHYNTLNPKLESASDVNKVRIRSFQQGSNVLRYNADYAPLHEIPNDEQPNDDRRVEIEASLVQSLNDDIATIFASLDSFNNFIGAPELVFSREYRDLRNLRRIYFNRLTDRINLKNFFEFFKWFDETVGDVLDQLIPYNSKYLGTNFIIESHALERPKFAYSYYDMYLGEIDRRQVSTIYLQQFIANLRKF